MHEKSCFRIGLAFSMLSRRLQQIRHRRKTMEIISYKVTYRQLLNVMQRPRECLEIDYQGVKVFILKANSDHFQTISVCPDEGKLWCILFKSRDLFNLAH